MKNNIMVVYKTKYGASQKCAEIVAGEFNAELMDLSEIRSPDELGKYETVVFVAGIYAGATNGAAKMSRIINKICKDKKEIFVFTVGNTPVERHDILEKVRNRSVRLPARSAVQFGHFVAKANFPTLNRWDKFILSVRRAAILSKPENARTAGELGFLKNYGKEAQPIDKEVIKKTARNIIGNLS